MSPTCSKRIISKYYEQLWIFPGGSVLKSPPADAVDSGSVPGLGRSPRGGNGSPLQCFCLENPMDRGAWRAKVHGVEELDTT